METQLRFKTESGTEYILKNIEMLIDPTGEDCPSVGPQGIPVAVTYTGVLARVGTPLREIFAGGFIEPTEEFHSVAFTIMPTLGERFTYYHELWDGCYSTPITRIDEEE